MRIMIDTNIIISKAIFSSKKMDNLIKNISEHHDVILCSYILEEARDVVKRKFESRELSLEKFFQELQFELIDTPTFDLLKNDIQIRDKKDYPVIMSAILSEADILITGDKDFSDLDLEKPEILTPTEFLEKYN